MQLIRARTVSHLVRDVAGLLRNAPEIPSRDGGTRELAGPVMCSVSDPTLHLPLNPGREGNPWVTLAEWPWLIAGRNDVAWLEHYLPRAKEFSDDGETWRAGYGPRLRDYGSAVEFAHQRVDQLHELVLRLKASRHTRQAVMSLWDPCSDNEPGSKDYPCTNWFQALIRDDLLHLHVVMRSNDLIWGLSGVNLHNWTMLQELLAACVGVGVGAYTHTAGSLHVYERHYKRLAQMANRPPDMPPALRAIPNMTLYDYTAFCERALVMATEYREGTRLPRECEAVAAACGPLGDWVQFMLLHSWLREPMAPWKTLADAVQNPEWLLALLEYLCRTGRISEVAVRVVLEGREWADTGHLAYVMSGTVTKNLRRAADGEPSARA